MPMNGHPCLPRTACACLREDGDQAWWEGFYRENVVNEAGKTERKRRAVNLGTLNEIRSEKAARQKLAVILEPINNVNRPKKMMTFRGFIDKYRKLKLANQKGTTVPGYETNIRAHYLPEFGDMQLSEISIEAVQAFLNQKASEGKSVQTLKNLKWGLSSIFVAAAKYGYMTSNPARGADLPPENIREQAHLPDHGQLNALIEKLPEPVSTAVWLWRSAAFVRRKWHSSGKTWMPARGTCGWCVPSTRANSTPRSTIARIARSG
jgi:Phage integrase, N-terminal SAM-like domain